MSREVDSRVVEMQFDNANFEKNTKQTMNTIDRLMEKLRFKGVEQGFEKLDEASEQVDFGTMSRSLDTLESKFSTLNIVATTALVNITNKVVDAGEKLVKSLSVDQVLSGWNKYTEKTANVQTIMNATGDSIDTVNGYLNKLMWYSDETSFSFSEMTSALSQMTASGGNIKKMIPMIMGIANATADAGKSGLAFQSTIRNITQSYSAGYLQLQDWKSLNLMGTATKALKQELIDTAVELGTIKKGDVTIASFETSLSKKWANTKVMEKTFEKYASMMEAAYDMTQKDKSLTTSDALKQLTGQYGELAERSALAAQQAKSFSEAIDATKDAVSSKWMKTFELIFGNKEEATNTWTELANRLYDIFVPPIEAMNDRFAEGLDSGWQQLHDKMGDQADAYTAVLQKVALANGIVTEESIEKAGSFGAALKESGASAELLQNGLDSTLLTLKDYLAMSDKELDARNVDRDLVQKEYDALTKLNEEFRTGKASMEDFASAINRTSGREHLMQSLWNIMDAIGKVVTPIKEAFDEIFPAADGDRIYSMAERLDLLTKKLIISDEAAAKIKTTFKGVFSVLRVGKDILTGLISSAVRIASAMKPLAEVFLDGASYVGKFVSEVTSSLHPLETLGNWVTKLVDAVAPLLYSFGSVADKVFAQFAKGAKNAFNEFDPEKMNQFIFGGLGASMLVSVKGFLSSIKTIGSSAKEIIGGIKETIESLGEAVDAWRQAKKAETLMTIAKAVALIAGSLTVLSMVKPERLGPAMLTLVSSMGGLLAVMQAMSVISKNIKSLKFGVLSAGMIAVSSAVLILAGALKVISTIGQENLLASVAALGGVMAELTAVAKVLSTGSGRFLKGSAGLIAFAAAIRVLASSMAVIGGMKVEGLIKGLSGIGGLCAELGLLAAAMNKVKFGVGKGTAFVLLATSMNLLVKAFKSFSEMSWDAIGRGLGVIAGALAEFALALNLTKGTLGSAVSLTMMAAAINLLVPAFNGLGSLGLGEIGTGLLAIAGAFGVLGGAAALLSPLTPVIVALSVSLSAVALSLGALLALNSASMFIGNLASSLSLLNSLNFQVFLNGIKSVAWLLVEFIAGVFEGLAKVSGSLVTSIATIIASVCDAIVLAAPSIGNALYVVGTTVIDTIVNLLAYVWDKIEPALNDLWDKFKAWCSAHNPFDPANWGGVSDKISENGEVIRQKFWQPFNDIMDELKNGNSFMAGIYQAFFGAGKNMSEGLAEGQKEGEKDARDASAEVANAAVETAKDTVKTHSPSEVMAQIGRYMTLGLAEGIQDEGALSRAIAAMQTVAVKIRNVFTTFWGIHSPSDLAASDAENILEGAILGMADADARERLKEASYDTASAVKDGMTQALDEATVAVQNSMTGLYQAMMSNGGNRLSSNALYVSRVKQAGEAYDKAVNDNVLIPGKNSITKAGNKGTPSSLDQLKEQIQNGVGKLLQPVSSYIDQTMDDLFKNADDALPDTGTTTGKTGSKSKASKTGKTLADTLSEAYTKQLKANKTAMSTASAEYELWEATTGDTASVEELLAQKTDSLTKEIELQTERVSIAKEQYDTLVAKVGKDDDKTKEAYSTLLSEQKSLATLRKEKQDSIFKVLQERYETDSKAAEDEYNLWSALYEDSAAVTEKSNRKIEYINKKIAVQAEILTAAEKDYTETKKEFGEKSAATQEAYRQYLEEQTSQQKLINELNQAQLDAFDQQVSYLEKQEKILSNRNSILLKLYGDGNLSDRESAYNEAVEKYGEGSLEARRASATGTMTAILGVGSALDSMSYSLRKVTNKQLKYDEAVKKFGKNSETALDALADLQDEQYSFVGFAEDLGEAFDMDDTGKQMTMQLGYAIARNWKPIQDGFDAVWGQVKTSFPEAAQRLANAFGMTTKEGFGTVATDLFATIKAAVTGDWGTAMTSGLVTVLDFAGSEFGQSLLSTAVNALYQLPDAFGRLAEGGTVKVLGQVVKVSGEAEGLGSILKNLSGLLGNTSGGTGLLGKAMQGLGSIGNMLGSGGLLGSLGELGGTLVNVLGSIGPEGWLIGAAIAGGGLLIANWDKVSDFFVNFFDWLGNAFSNLWDWISNGFKGLVDIGGDLISGLWNGITGAAGAIWDGVTGFCGSILDGVCDFFGIHSPSTVMAQIGEYLSLGLAQGIVDSTDSVTSGVDEMSRAALSTMTEVVERVGDIASEDFDYEPSIRPVVDMTDVQNGADWLNGNLFRESALTLNADRTAGLAANVVRQAEAERNAAWEDSRDDGDTMSNRDIVESVQALGEHVDNIAYAVSQMKMSINGKKFVGEIITDVDEQLGKIAKRR